NLALLVETIDDRYLAFTQVPILDGVIQVQVPIGSASSEDADESISFRGNRRFAILQFDPPEATQYGYRLAKLLPAPDPRSCGIDIQIASYSYMSKPTEKVASFCRKNTAGTIQVMVYPESTPKITAQMIDPVVDRIEAIMAVYQSKGLTAASLKDAWMRRVQVVVEAGSGDPYYSSVNGVVHIPEDSLGSTYTKNLNYELAHELAHWVQDEAYNFTSSYWANKTGVSSEAKWWLEVAAENMVFLYDPNYIEQNLTAFGMTTPATSDTPFQYSPNQWNDQLYLHAQLVKLFMCSNEYACPVSEEEFIKAINTGDYPYNESALAKVKENLSDYAIYLLGKPVISANSTIPANGSITKGTGYGEFIQVVNNGKGENEYKKTGYKPQIEQITADGITKIKVAASIQKFGVYPLTLTSPTKEGQFGFPVEIVVESGTPFYYTFDDGTEKYHDGSTKITLGPLHGMLGYRKIRIVAFATDQVRNFNAMVQPLDLTGDWLIFSSGLTGQNYSCSDEADAEVTIDYEELAKFSAIYTTLPAAVAGVYTPDPGGQGYTWAAQPGADLSFGSDVQLEIIGSMLLGSDTLRVQSKLVIPQQSQSSDGTIYLLSGMPLIGIVFVAMFRKKTRLAYGAIILCGAILLTGCFAFGGFYGTISTDTALTQFEPVNGQTIQSIADSLNSETVSDEEDAAAIPTDFGNIPAKYIFKGNTTAQIELHILSAEGEEQTSESVCSGTVSYNVVAVFVEDGKITSLGDQ
ncbi:MAG: hypothetical protein HY835_11075, partial [Anaerolineae bacterium]|nr:hypothetical protein [Anaerolineae bacterium]